MRVVSRAESSEDIEILHSEKRVRETEREEREKVKLYCILLGKENSIISDLFYSSRTEFFHEYETK